MVVESGEPREVMHFCLLCGYGANAVNPYLAFEAHPQDAAPTATCRPTLGADQLCRPVHHRRQEGHPQDDVQDGHLHAAKLPCRPSSSRPWGWTANVVQQYFTGTASRIEGVGLDVIAREALARHRTAFGPREPGALELDYGGEYHFRLDGENHLWNPTTVTKLQHAVVQNDPAAYEEYARAVNEQGQRAVHAAGAVRVRARRAGAAGGGRAGQRDRQAVLHRRHVARLDQQRGPRDAGHGDEPAGRHVEHGRRGRGPGPLPAAAQRRFAQLRRQAGGQRPLRRDDRIPVQGEDLADQDGPGGQAGRRRPVARLTR